MIKRSIRGMIGTIEIVLIVVVLIVAGLIIWRVASGDEDESTDETVSEEVTAEETTNNNTANTAPQVLEGWATYTNDELGFSFIYPNRWGQIESDTSLGYDQINAETTGDIAAYFFTFSNLENIAISLASRTIQPAPQGGSMLFAHGYEEIDDRFLVCYWGVCDSELSGDVQKITGTNLLEGITFTQDYLPGSTETIYMINDFMTGDRPGLVIRLSHYQLTQDEIMVLQSEITDLLNSLELI